MNKQPYRAVLALFVLTLLTPVSLFAAQESTQADELRRERIERADERRMRAQERLEEQRERLLERIEERRERLAERLSRIEERVCDRLERLEERTGVDLTLPAFCAGGGGGGGGEDEKPDLTLSASPMTISAGATSTLSWDSTRADACFASGGWSGTRPVDGTAEVSPTATTTYTLTCGNEAGSTTKSVSVGVGSGGSTTTPSVDLSAASSTILAGATTTLSWTSMHATTCLASGGWTGARATTGSQSVAPNATTTYTLACGNGTATATDSVTVGVRATSTSSLPMVDLTANPTTVASDSTSTLSWTSTNADTCQASGGWSGARTASGTLVVSPTASTTYTLTCGNENGSTSDSVMVAVTPSGPTVQPTVDLTANPTTVASGSTSTLSWTSTNADTCLASGGWTGARATTGSQSVAPNATTSYALACSNAVGTATDTVEVRVTATTTATTSTTTLNKVVVSEFVFNAVSEPAEEWVEIYNGTGASVDLMNWTIGDASSTDLIATTSRMLPAGGYIIITSSSSLAATLNSAGIAAIAAASSIGANGLSNTGDVIRLGNAAGAEVDAVSYGTNTSAFSPSVSIAGAVEGNSVARVPVTTDTDTATDWTMLTTPTPGS